MWRYLHTPTLITLAVLVAAFFLGGPAALLTVAILGILEVTLSFDNAIVNAKVLGRMNPQWQKLFLTVGVVIAVFGMRLIFPLLIVSMTALINPLDALHMALASPAAYAHHVTAAHVSIAAFGGTFLLMLFLTWLVDDEKDVHWIGLVERPLSMLAAVEGIATVVTGIVLLIGAVVSGHEAEVLIAGLAGLVTYLAVDGIDGMFDTETTGTVAKAGLATFLYLEVLDASFSFDGVVGAFAITNNIVLVAAGLGIGALFIRGMTVYLTNAGKLAEFRYLDHGAHWAIGVLAALLLLTIHFEVPEVVTGGLSVALIAAALASSVKANQDERVNLVKSST